MQKFLSKITRNAVKSETEKSNSPWDHMEGNLTESKDFLARI